MIPLPALAKSEGSNKRVRELCEGFLNEGFKVATCAALDENFKIIDNVKNYYLDVPSPAGLPMFLGKRILNVAEKTGIKSRKSINSFEEILFLTGAISKTYFKKNIECVRKAIRDFKPDIVYSEFNLGAIIAGKIEDVQVYSNYSYPVQHTYACTPKLSKGVNSILYEYGFNRVNSVLEIFLMADKLIIPSCYDLEPIENKKAVFTGPFKLDNEKFYGKERNCITAYMGCGTISEEKLVKELKEGFFNTQYEVYIAASNMKCEDNCNIHVAPRHDFSKILPRSIAFINHGGQNSIMDGLKHGVPQIICPGKVFERKYNGASIGQKGAGIVISESEFSSNILKKAINMFEEDPSYEINSNKLWESIANLGGVNRVIEEILNSIE